MMFKTSLLAAAASAALFVATPVCAQAGGQPQIHPWGFSLEGRDLSVAPGDDFNRHVNGTWLRETPIPADKSSYGMFDKLYDDSLANLRAIIEGSAAQASDANAARIGAFYRSFVDEAAVEALGARPLQADLAAIRTAGTHRDLARLMGRGQDGFHVSLFDLQVFEDLVETSTHSAYLSQGGLGLPDRDYYLSDAFTTQRTAYLAYVEKMLELIGWPEPKRTAADILAFETAVAQKHWTNVQSRQVDKIYNPATWAELETAAPGFPWRDWAEGARSEGVDRVIVIQNTAVPGIAEVFMATPVATLQAWQAFRTADEAAPYLSDAFLRARFDFRGRVLYGQQELTPRWRRGVTLVDDQMGEALGQEYVRRHFPPAAKAQVEALVNDLLAAMKTRIENLEWMSPETRAQALEKLAAFRVKIGYPSKWRSYDGLITEAGDLYGNVQRATTFNWTYELARLDRPVDPEEFSMTPQTVNAGYSPPQNSITFPAAILQPPFFDPNADPAVNYGAIGGVIGHEIVHGFDDQGRKFDAQGRLRDWWTASDAAQFEARADVLGAQYSALEPLPGVRVNGDLTMGENIADLGGLILGLEGYRLSLAGREAPVLDGLTGEQRVFLGWGQVWRQNIRDEAIRQQVATDPHAPDRYRGGQTVRNIDDWYRAFDVKPGQAAWIAPEQRARIW